MSRFLTVSRVTAALVAVVTIGAAMPNSAIGAAVQLPGSKVELETIGATLAFDYDATVGGPGPSYYNDCATFVNTSTIAAKHVQVVFAQVDTTGAIGETLPVDKYFRNGLAPGAKSGGCRDHLYERLRKGRSLIAWIATVDFADGTSWHAPPQDQMTPYILEALSDAN